jgi:hypothetical protein
MISLAFLINVSRPIEKPYLNRAEDMWLANENGISLGKYLIGILMVRTGG